MHFDLKALCYIVVAHTDCRKQHIVHVHVLIVYVS